MVKSLLSILIFLSGTSLANKDAVITNLERFFGKVEKQDIVNTNFEGVYEVIVYNPIESLLVSKDGRYLIQGNVVDLKTRELMPVSQKVKNLKSELINAVDDADKIIYPADKEEHIVHVFTDVDCPFCRKLHFEMDKINELGITVKYLAAPLASLHPTAQSKMQKIWCAEDRVMAFDQYNISKEIPDSEKCISPVAKQLLISKQLGVNGTPAIFLADGTHLPGYLKPEDLLKTIERKLGK